MGKGIFDYHFDECIEVNKNVVKKIEREIIFKVVNIIQISY